MDSITIQRYNQTFTVGEASWNHKGEYIVLSISDDGETMEVEYTELPYPETQTLKTNDQAKVIYNENRRQLQSLRMKALDLDNDKEAFTLGYIAQCGWMTIRLKEADMPWFKRTYEQLTGKPIPTPNNKENLTVVPDDAQRGQTYYIIFPEPHDELKGHLSFGSPVKWHEWAGGAKVHSKNVMLNFMSKGLLLGYNRTRIDAIRERVINKTQFDKGVQVAKELKLA